MVVVSLKDEDTTIATKVILHIFDVWSCCRSCEYSMFLLLCQSSKIMSVHGCVHLCMAEWFW